MKDNHTIEVKEIEIGHLDFKYGHTRIQNLKSVLRISNSIERFGQITPVIVVPGDIPSYILIDGFLRVAALKRCGKDTVLAEIWEEKEQNLIIYTLAKTQDRKWDMFEQAILLRELHIGHQISQIKIANLLGKGQSWICRRFALLDALDEKTIELVRKGNISSWSASRILAPMARANSKHARVLAENLLKESISTREFDTLFRHYKKSGKKEREEIVNRPHVFIKALKMREQEKKAGILKEGPEGKWIKEIKEVGNILHRLEKEVPIVFYEKQSAFDRRLLFTAFEDTKEKYLSLNHQLRRFYGKDDIPRNKVGNFGIGVKGSENQEDKPDTESLKKYSSSGRAGQAQRCAGIDHQISGDHAHNQRTVSILQGECSSGA